MKKMLFGLVLSILFLPAHSASAHILITDTSGTQGAVLHISPDDDPIAGQSSTLFLDLQKTPLSNNTKIVLEVKQRDQTTSIDGTLDGSLATFTYVFPEQGVYTLTFLIASESKHFTYEVPWRITRGTVSAAPDTPSYVWAELLLLVSSLGTMLLVTIMLARWRHIWQQSHL